MTIEERIANLEKELAELKEERKKEKAVTRFEPKKGERYITLGGTGTSYKLYYDESAPNICRTNHNNIFRTSSEANLKKYALDVIRVQNRLMQLHEELCPNFWRGSMSDEVCFGESKGKMQWFTVTRDKEAHGFVPFTYTAARKACEILNAECFMMGDDEHEAD